MAWMRLSEYCAQRGDTRDGVNKRLRTGKWLRDVHVRKPAGSAERWVNLEAVDDWAAGKKPAHLHGSGR